MGGPGIVGSNINFTFGSAVGAGIQTLFSTNDYQKAIWAAFLEWDMDLLEEDKHKTFCHAVEAIKLFVPMADVLGRDWEIYQYEKDGKLNPAVELSARVELPNGFVYRIYIDIVLRNKKNGELVVVEIKTDGYKYIQSEKYANSNQALSYSIILDKIHSGKTSLVVWYFVYYTSLGHWEFFPFHKSRTQKANWIRTVLYDTENIQRCLDNEFFPKQGESCVDFGRTCDFFECCDLSKRALYGSEEVLKEKIDKELATDYTFKFTLEEIISKQMEVIDNA